MTLLTPAARHQFKKSIQEWTQYRDALVARRPGWIDKYAIYVWGDGSVIAAETTRSTEVIVAFPPVSKFKPRGTTRHWRDRIGPVIRDQPLPLFLLAYAFVGPLLRFAPPGLVNPQCELVGGPETGKSTLAALAASVWAGNPNSDVGGGETWDATVNYLDAQKLRHSDGLLFLDETALAGDSGHERTSIRNKAAFKLAGTGTKRRLNETDDGDPLRLATLSTSNTALAEARTPYSALDAATASRVMTIHVPKPPLGALSFVPIEFETTAAAINSLRSAIDLEYGRPGRRFVQRLAEKAALNEDQLRTIVRTHMDHFQRQLGPSSGLSARTQNLLALTYTAGILARQCGLIPEDWGSIKAAVVAVAKMSGAVLPASAGQSALDRVRAYYEANKSNLVDLRGLRRPLPRQAFTAAAGFVRDVGQYRELFVPAKVFRTAVPDARSVMAALRTARHAKTEGGRHPKLTIKAPSAVCATGRVYCIRIPRSG
jgi:hypothetical protein